MSLAKFVRAGAVAAGALVIATQVNAADMYAGGGMKDAPIYAPPSTWTGIHVGLGVGGEAVDHRLSSGGTSFDGIASTGVIGTVEVGYDRQMGSFVAGVYFNYDFGDNVSTNLKTSLGAGIDAAIAQTDSWSAGGRLGYLVNPSTLAYALGGYTQSRFELQGVSALSWGRDLDGWTVGGGLETKLAPNWTLKGEYRYTEFESVKPFKNLSAVHLDSSVQSARLVLSYKFDLFGGDYMPLK
jgi:outer membrane immunogenic protein